MTALVAIAIFGVSMAFMFAFATQPLPTSKPDEAILQARAHDVLRIIGTSPGFPVSWAEDAQSVQALERLGLVTQGTQRTLDPAKFDALAKGEVTTTNVDDRVDYEEAKDALGLEGYEFHLRAYPVFDPFGGADYGLEDMESWRPAYVGDYNGLSENGASIDESAFLDELPIAFENSRADLGGDKMADSGDYLREHLLPLLGGLPDVEVLVGGSDYVFQRMDETQLDQQSVPRPPSGRHVIAVGDSTGGPMYEPGTDHRAVVATVDLSGLTNPHIGFWEVANGEGVNATDCIPGTQICTYSESVWQDYGVVEARPAGESEWTTLTPVDDLHIGRMPSVLNTLDEAPQVFPPEWSWKTVDFTKCASCIGSTEVELAVRWIADADGTRGTGWAIDDFTVFDEFADEPRFSTDFAPPTYDAVIIGSDVAHNALTSAEVKYGLRDYVEEEGGQLIVFGMTSNTQWLQPLFHVGVASAAGGAFAEDTTHPILTVPNTLEYGTYDNQGMVWEFSSGDEQYFTKVVGEGSDGHVFAVSNENAFGDAGGTVILSTWVPGALGEEEAAKLFANAFMYGRYHYLYLEAGPTVPSGSAVSSASMTNLMDKTLAGEGSYVEMQLILYLWS